mmetsp:Transcript_99803/g.173191  ORF Transcript_99803/g.173191 Transcript_99803/m.173191 type:complete len:263 (+) Transcript_99803:54-842(+)
MASQVGPFTAVLVLLGAGACFWQRYKDPQVQTPATPSTPPVVEEAVPEDFVGGAIGAIMTILLTIWLALIIYGQVAKGSEVARGIAKVGILGVFFFAYGLLWLAALTPFYSTGFIFNGPKHASPVFLEKVFEQHRQAYVLAPAALQAMTLMALAVFIITTSLTIAQSTVNCFRMIMPSSLKTFDGVVFFKIAAAFVAPWALVIGFCSLLLLAAWCCWVVTLFSGELIGETVFWWNERALSWVEAHTDKMLSRFVFAVFGKLF